MLAPYFLSFFFVATYERPKKKKIENREQVCRSNFNYIAVLSTQSLDWFYILKKKIR